MTSSKTGKEWQNKWDKEGKDGNRLSSPYGMRKHPVTGEAKMHKGDNYALPKGTPIPAVKDGEVVANRYQENGYGNYIRTTNNDGTYSDYAHMTERSPLKQGDKVSQGDEIAKVGF